MLAAKVAFKIAQNLDSPHAKAETLDKIGAAWAEIGDFEKAVKSAKLSYETGACSKLEGIEKNIRLYELKQPSRMPAVNMNAVKQSANVAETQASIVSRLINAAMDIRVMTNVELVTMSTQQRHQTTVMLT